MAFGRIRRFRWAVEWLLGLLFAAVHVMDIGEPIRGVVRRRVELLVGSDSSRSFLFSGCALDSATAWPQCHEVEDFHQWDHTESHKQAKQASGIGWKSLKLTHIRIFRPLREKKSFTVESVWLTQEFSESHQLFLQKTPIKAVGKINLHQRDVFSTRNAKKISLIN